MVAKNDVTIYPNNKPYITKEIKECMNRKKQAFSNKDRAGLVEVQKELKQLLTKAREQHRQTMEQSFLTWNTKKLWDTMTSVIIWTLHKNKLPPWMNSKNQTSWMISIWDLTQSFSHERDRVMQSLWDTNANCWLEEDLSVQCLCSGVHTNKSSGPDGLSAFLLKSCAEELTPAWSPIFKQSLDTHTVPALWKRSIIIPVPKKPCATKNNDFCPVDLTSIILKRFDKYAVSLLKTEVQPLLDTSVWLQTWMQYWGCNWKHVALYFQAPRGHKNLCSNFIYWF